MLCALFTKFLIFFFKYILYIVYYIYSKFINKLKSGFTDKTTGLSVVV